MPLGLKILNNNSPGVLKINETFRIPRQIFPHEKGTGDAIINVGVQFIDNASLVTIFSIIISVVVAISFGVYLQIHLQPISNLKDAAAKIGVEDYVAACKFISKTQRGDEIGKLASGIERMRKALNP